MACRKQKLAQWPHATPRVRNLGAVLNSAIPVSGRSHEAIYVSKVETRPACQHRGISASEQRTQCIEVPRVVFRYEVIRNTQKRAVSTQNPVPGVPLDPTGSFNDTRTTLRGRFNLKLVEDISYLPGTNPFTVQGAQVRRTLIPPHTAYFHARGSY